MCRIKVNSRPNPLQSEAFMWHGMLHDRSLCTSLTSTHQKYNQTFICLTWTSMKWTIKLRATYCDASQLVFKCTHLLCFSWYPDADFMTKLHIQQFLITTSINKHTTLECCCMVEHCSVSVRAQYDPLSQLSEHLHNSSTSQHSDALWESRRCHSTMRMHREMKLKPKMVGVFWHVK